LDNDLVRYFAYTFLPTLGSTFNLKLSSNVDLVIARRACDLTSSDYGSFNHLCEENIYVSPIPCLCLCRGAGISVVQARRRRRDQYRPRQGSVLAPTIIDLTMALPVTLSAGPGAALTNFFGSRSEFSRAMHFELFNMSGNVD